MVRFCTRSYVSSHGKEPRGRGSWAFGVVVRAPGGVLRIQTIFAPSCLTLTQAKQWAAETVGARSDLVKLEVMP